MTIEQRIRACRLIERMERQKSFSQKLGLENRSEFHGKRIIREERNHTC